MIDYDKIAAAIEHYKKAGYQYIEVPWLVGKEAIDATKPPESQYFDTVFGHLVGSGEQSFIHIRQHLEPGQRYQCVTPCFRDEVTDELHRMWFLKVELIQVLEEGDKWTDALENMVDDAYDFFRDYVHESNLEVVDLADSFDIEANGVEVGSYGVRSFKGFSWVYGTGLAEPRLSTVLSMN